MNRADRRLSKHVDRLLREQRPPARDLGADIPAARLAAQLHAAHPGSAEPSPEFVDSLARTLRQQQHLSGAPAMPERRRLLAAAGLAAAAGVGAGFGIDRLREANPGTSPAQAALQPADGAWVPVTTLAAVRAAGAVRFSAGGVEGYVLHRDGSLSALSAACSDQGCILTDDLAHQRLVCPCHGATFGLDGLPTSGASYSHKVTPLPTISVRSRGDHVEVLVPRTA